MLTDIVTFIALVIAEIICISLIIIIKNKISKSQLRSSFLFLTSMMLLSCTGVILQDILSNPLNIAPVYFEYITYIGNVFLSVSFLFLGIIYANTKITLKKFHILIFVIPILSLLILWTNDLHHLFYKEYSIYLSKTVFGAFFQIYNIYTILLFFIGILYLLTYSVKNSKFFSKQAILIIISALIPIAVNVLSTLKVIDATIYITPISFTISILILALAIFKFKFLATTPIALQKIVDRMSDGYIVLDENNKITDFNQTFLLMFKCNHTNIRNLNIFNLIKNSITINLDTEKLHESLSIVRKTINTQSYEEHIAALDKYFRIEISSLNNNKSFLGTLILFKDITQHINDLSIIQSNQDMLMEKERLASLGQLIGGIAHNLKTPIMSISGAAEGLTDLVNEYDSSIEDPEVTVKDHHDIANDMREWINKIRTHTSYMSDVITAVKGQAVTFSDDQSDSFTIDELLKRVTILMKHELKSALIELQVKNNVDANLVLQGNVNSLVQVINNMISNAIQSYNNEPNKEIILSVTKQNDELIISVIDTGCGMSQEVQKKLFREMITTKGKNGTGLGLFMSYSNIKGHFNGNITFESEENIGTTFNIILPLK